MSPTAPLPLLADEFEVELPDGAILRGTRRGSGPVVMALHGWTQTRENWDEVGQRLLDSGHELITLDSRGHGRSTRGTLEPSVEQLRDDLRMVLDALAVERVVLVGHSLGGATVMALGATGDHRIAGMVVVGTTACFTYPRFFLPVAKGVTALMGFGTRRGIGGDDVVGRVLTRLALGPRAPKWASEQTHRLMVETEPEVVHHQFARVVATDLRDRLPFIDAPMTVMGGQVDLLTPITHTHLIARLVPHTKKVVLPGCGHMVMLERVDETTAEVEAMVKQVW
jgi:pimeloyl-ACP methyl ester carboxylesterase